MSCVVVTGCGKQQRELTFVEGRVTYQGSPVAGGTVRFTPEEVAIGAAQRPATSVTDAEGRYRVKAYRDQAGIPPGDYLVSVMWYEGSMADPASVRHLIPEKYSDASTSGLSASVPKEIRGALKLDFDLK
ncbi:carboxypeptidase-like regulatory domain-containing protein [Aeoliella sp. ICT_H6.2]|uniref:Carboxypeptidase-like regulatory domain-containing protein n=1 Tax=Aeoliella straminimaris TaxID=2954799 RepID=A0A9X2FAJ9_9BACT|nr:carboxypeptidase-like regulatory domain-containing protein [Aeoliella straminimaris]MCO6044673.1 carboxypeptidase-like regulatory domain-containing protein [Aeoliella straminimaris]